MDGGNSFGRVLAVRASSPGPSEGGGFALLHDGESRYCSCTVKMVDEGG